MACFRLDLDSQVFSNNGYPFHMVKYQCFPGGPQWDTMYSTLYSSSHSIRSGGGKEQLGPCIAVF